MPKAQWSQFNPAWWEARVDDGRWRLSCSKTSWAVQEHFVGIDQSRREVLPSRVVTAMARIHCSTPETDIVANMEAAERWLLDECERRYLATRTLQP